mgnify:CR=1 FL=1
MMEDFWDPYGEPPEPPEHFDFMEDCEIEDDGLPPVENLQTACGHGVPEQSPAMIEGVLRKGHNAAGRPQQGRQELRPYRAGRVHCKRYTMDEPF